MSSSALVVWPEDVKPCGAGMEGAVFCRGSTGPLAAPLPEISLSLERLVPGVGGATAVARLPFRHSERIEKLRLRLAALKSAVTVNNALVRPRLSATRTCLPDICLSTREEGFELSEGCR